MMYWNSRPLLCDLDCPELSLESTCVQAETERKLSALLPSVLDRAFKGEL